jgi:hypothetical protein
VFPDDLSRSAQTVQQSEASHDQKVAAHAPPTPHVGAGSTLAIDGWQSLDMDDLGPDTDSEALRSAWNTFCDRLRNGAGPVPTLELVPLNDLPARLDNRWSPVTPAERSEVLRLRRHRALRRFRR